MKVNLKHTTQEIISGELRVFRPSPSSDIEQNVENDELAKLIIGILDSKNISSIELAMKNTSQSKGNIIAIKDDSVMEGSTESFTKNAEKQRKKEIEDVTKIKEYMKDYKDPGGVDTPHIIGKTLDNRRQQDDDAKQNEAALKDTTKGAIQKSILGTDMNDLDRIGPLEERKTSVEDHTEMSLKNHLSNGGTTEGQNLRGLSGRGKLLKGHSPNIFQLSPGFKKNFYLRS
jgi:hypothetical protein